LTAKRKTCGGYFVGHRTVIKEGANHNQVEGLFHLVQRQDEWKIEDIYFTTINRQPLDNWLSVARDYQQFAAVDKGKSLSGGKGKAVGVFLLAVLLGIARFGQSAKAKGTSALLTDKKRAGGHGQRARSRPYLTRSPAPKRGRSAGKLEATPLFSKARRPSKRSATSRRRVVPAKVRMALRQTRRGGQQEGAPP
jgi:hypothetical protein